ncbi:DUF4190 domain-containing protein [Clavibacter sp. Sh2088]|uniref:DUF4190 domain-containing protein n=1 Tax=Clavibacter sp. Sh2088 TaxID=3397676 RepID=UPI0039E093E1
MSDERDPGTDPDEPRRVSPYGPADADAGTSEDAVGVADAATAGDAQGAPDAPPLPPAGYDAAGPDGQGAAGPAAAHAAPAAAAAAAAYAAPGGYAPPAPGAYAPPAPGAYAPPAPGAYAPPAPGGYAAPADAPPVGSGGPSRPRGGKGLAIAALVVGIVGFLGSFIPFLNYVTAVPALVAVVLGIISLARRMDGKPLALTGLILGAVGFVLSIVLAIVYTFAFVASLSEAVESSGVDSGFASPEPAPGEDDDAAALPGTSPDDPLPIGTPVTGDGIDGPEWQVTLGQPILDATAAVLAADPTNQAPAEGMQYAVVPVTVTYLGATEGDPLSELALGFLAADGSQYAAADSFAIAPAPAFTDNEELLESQGTATGNVVIEIPIEGAADGLWATAPGTLAEAYYFRAG